MRLWREIKLCCSHSRSTQRAFFSIANHKSQPRTGHTRNCHRGKTSQHNLGARQSCPRWRGLCASLFGSRRYCFARHTPANQRPARPDPPPLPARSPNPDFLTRSNAAPPGTAPHAHRPLALSHAAAAPRPVPTRQGAPLVTPGRAPQAHQAQPRRARRRERRETTRPGWGTWLRNTIFFYYG